MPRPKKGEKTPGSGRIAGVPNKSTAAVRDAIALFADGNVHKLQVWLDRVADGDADAGVRADPAKAADIFLRAIEYHIPKLSRAEVTGENGGPVQITAVKRTIIDPKDGA